MFQSNFRALREFMHLLSVRYKLNPQRYCQTHQCSVCWNQTAQAHSVPVKFAILISTITKCQGMPLVVVLDWELVFTTSGLDFVFLDYFFRLIVPFWQQLLGNAVGGGIRLRISFHSFKARLYIPVLLLRSVVQPFYSCKAHMNHHRSYSNLMWAKWNLK